MSEKVHCLPLPCPSFLSTLYLMSRRFYSQQSPSPSVTNLIQPTNRISDGASLVCRSSLCLSVSCLPLPVPLQLYQQESLRRTFYIRQGAPSSKTPGLPLTWNILVLSFTRPHRVGFQPLSRLYGIRRLPPQPRPTAR
jgi:hypothetical protein